MTKNTYFAGYSINEYFERVYNYKGYEAWVEESCRLWEMYQNNSVDFFNFAIENGIDLDKRTSNAKEADFVLWVNSHNI